MIEKKIIQLFFMLGLVLFTQNIYSQTDTILDKKIIDYLLKQADIKEYYKKKHIPRNLKLALRSLSGHKIKMVNKGKKYRSSDAFRLCQFFLPKRQLLFIAYGEPYWILSYDIAGFSVYSIVVICKMGETGLVNSIYSFDTSIQISAFDKLKECISKELYDLNLNLLIQKKWI